MKKSSLVNSWGEWFDRAATHYQDPRMKMAYYLDAKTGRPVPNDVMKATYLDITKKLKSNKTHTLLDVGCGVGLFIQLHKNQFQSIIGTDISLKMAQNAFRLNKNSFFINCPAEPLPFKNQSIDRLLCYSVFHYVKDYKNAQLAIDEFIRVTKKTGFILIGDILTDIPQKEEIKLPESEDKKRWWPPCLNHALKKIKYTPDFFLDYCKRKKYRCEILKQKIPGRWTPEFRFDVRLRPAK